jgi:isopentenyl-diphosphate Delta-isomerase
MDIRQFEDRKRDHLRHALDPANQASDRLGLDRIHLFHEALPDLDFSQIQLSSTCLGDPAPTPFYVAGMTAGHPDAPALNRALAVACARRGWAMGVGSQRRELEALVLGDGSFAAAQGGIDQWARLRDEVPGLALFANIGVSQLARVPVSRVRALVEAIRATALVVHANALQEALQPEGTPNFSGALEALRELCRELGTPVVLKETGCGFSRRTLERLADVGLAAVDVSGLGGTHWGRIEGARAREQVPGGVQALAAETFAGWGEPTPESVLSARAALPA